MAVSFMEEMLGSSMLNKSSMEADLLIECERPEQGRHCWSKICSALLKVAKNITIAPYRPQNTEY